jgi:NADH:ubiquinone oxidoreductase subunit 6 (subunit J)
VLVELIWIALQAGGWIGRPGKGPEVTKGHIEDLGMVLFQQHLLAFELLSLVLLAAIFGLMVIGRRK